MAEMIDALLPLAELWTIPLMPLLSIAALAMILLCTWFLVTE